MASFGPAVTKIAGVGRFAVLVIPLRSSGAHSGK
jgi:hypothetical protein